MKTAEKDVSLEDVPVAQNTYPLGVPYYGFCISFMFLLQVAFASLRSSRANHGTVLTLGIEFTWRLLTGACLFEPTGYPKGPCSQEVYTLAPMYPYRDYFKINVYSIWVHGPLG